MAVNNCVIARQELQNKIYNTICTQKCDNTHLVVSIHFFKMLVISKVPQKRMKPTHSAG